MADQVGEALAGELVGDMQDLDDAPGRGDVELVVEAPDVVGVGGNEAVGGCGGGPEAGPLVAPRRHPEALFTPQTLELLAVELVAFSDEHGVSSAIAPAGMGSCEGPQPGPQARIGMGLEWGSALGGAVLTDDLTGPSLREVESVLEHPDRPASPRRAYQFPFATSFNAAMSTAWSATMPFRALFSFSSSFSRRASLAFMPPYWLRQRW